MGTCPKVGLMYLTYTFNKASIYFPGKEECCIKNSSSCFLFFSFKQWLCASSPCEVLAALHWVKPLCSARLSVCLSVLCLLQLCHQRAAWHYWVALSPLNISSTNKRLHKSSAHHRDSYLIIGLCATWSTLVSMFQSLSAHTLDFYCISTLHKYKYTSHF